MIVKIVILLILISIIFYIKNEPFARFLGTAPTLKRYKWKVVTPLRDWISPQKTLKIINTPNFLMCDPAYLSPVRNQGNCGGCWAYVITSMMSDRITLNTHKNIDNINAQLLLNCYNNGKGCNGEIPEDVLLWMDKTNFKLNVLSENFKPIKKCIPLENGFQIKYDSIKSLCRYVKGEGKLTKEEQIIINENILNMKLEIMSSGPFLSSVTTYSDFFTYNGKQIYKPSKKAKPIGGHAVLVVGWCDKGVDQRPGFKDGYWICQNSWGLDWPKNTSKQLYNIPGYFSILMGSNMCGIEIRCGSADVNIPIKGRNELVITDINKYYDFIKSK